jgi:hypothetical protein
MLGPTIKTTLIVSNVRLLSDTYLQPVMALNDWAANYELIRIKVHLNVSYN